MQAKAIKTNKISIGENIFDVLDKYILHLESESIIAITSKIISTCYGFVASKDLVKNKAELIKKEADIILSDIKSEWMSACLTIKSGIIIPSAGIDESNAEGFYVLFPHNIAKIVGDIWDHLSKKHGIEDFGIIITDSTVNPLRSGVVGIGIGWCGFEPTRNYILSKDIFGQKMNMTKVNVVDSICNVATFVMGEGGEQTPISIISDFDGKVVFTKNYDMIDISISKEDDLYSSIIYRQN
jgi:F420-0:gamma-glutamyl ligase